MIIEKERIAYESITSKTILCLEKLKEETSPSSIPNPREGTQEKELKKGQKTEKKKIRRTQLASSEKF